MSSVTILDITALILFCIVLIYYSYTRIRMTLLIRSMNTNLINDSRIELARVKVLWIRIGLYIVSLGFIVSAYVLPYPNHEDSKILNLQGVDILFIVDTSLSMNSVDSDPTRLQRFKDVILSILPELYGNRLGILAFAGSPFLYCPLTTDIYAFQDYIKGLDVDIIGDKGTEFSSVFKKADEILNSERILRNRIVVLVSDGEDHSGFGIQRLNAKFVVWGIGDPMGAPIYYQDNETKTRGYVTRQGTIVSDSSSSDVIHSIPDLSLLVDIARRNQGEFHNITRNAQGAWKLVDTIEYMNKNSSQFLESITRQKKAHYNLFPAVVLLLIDILFVDLLIIGRRRSIWMNSIFIVMGIQILFVFPQPMLAEGFFDPARSKVYKGIEAYENGEYSKSVQEFSKAEQWISGDHRLHFNKGTALLKEGRFPESIHHFERAIEATNSSNKDIRADIYYNMAKAYESIGDKKKAHKTYRQALQERPDFPEAKKNLELLYRNQKSKSTGGEGSPDQNSTDSNSKNQEGDIRGQENPSNDSEENSSPNQSNRSRGNSLNRDEAERIMDSLEPDKVKRQKSKGLLPFKRDKFW